MTLEAQNLKLSQEENFVALRDNNNNIVFWTNHFIDSASINLECWLEIALRHGIKMLDDNLAIKTIAPFSEKLKQTKTQNYDHRILLPPRQQRPHLQTRRRRNT